MARIHIELLCGGDPSAQAAMAIRRTVAAVPDCSCCMIHLDASDQEHTYGFSAELERPPSYRFIPLTWDNGVSYLIPS